MTKDGIGTWTLSGNNLYSGGTVVNGGTLLVNNTSGSGTGSGDVIVNMARLTTLGGTGTIGGRVIVAPGKPCPGKWRTHHGDFHRRNAHTAAHLQF